MNTSLMGASAVIAAAAAWGMSGIFITIIATESQGSKFEIVINLLYRINFEICKISVDKKNKIYKTNFYNNDF